ncbi:MAG: DUF4394 domain-containing protein [Limisphaerales bacterium]
MKTINHCLLVVSVLPAAVLPVAALDFYGLGLSGDRLVTFREDGSVQNDVPITGLNAGDTLADIDLFASDNLKLYGLGTSGQLYTINAGGAAATVGAGAAVGSPVAMDFNPAADRLRVLSGDSNFRIQPFTGALAASDGLFTYAASDPNFGADPMLVAAAYANNLDNPGSTTFFSLDAGLNTLVRHSGGPQFSTLNTVAGLTLGGIPFDLGLDAGFDIISPAVGLDWAYVSNGNDFYSLNLAGGQLSSLAVIGGPTRLRSFTGQAVPEGGTWLAGAAALVLGGLGFRRRMSCR